MPELTEKIRMAKLLSINGWACINYLTTASNWICTDCPINKCSGVDEENKIKALKWLKKEGV